MSSLVPRVIQLPPSSNPGKLIPDHLYGVARLPVSKYREAFFFGQAERSRARVGHDVMGDGMGCSLPAAAPAVVIPAELNALRLSREADGTGVPTNQKPSGFPACATPTPRVTPQRPGRRIPQRGADKERQRGG